MDTLPKIRIFSGDISVSQGQSALAREVEKYLDKIPPDRSYTVAQSTCCAVLDNEVYVYLTITVTLG